MYYIPKSKTTVLLLSFIATMLAEIQDENKRQQEVKTTKAMMRGQENGQTCIFLFFLFLSQSYLFGTYITLINAFTFLCMIIPLGPHLVYT